MINGLQDRVKLNNGIEMPGFGLGVYKAEEGREVVDAVRTAVDHGYRLVDTASFYKNEQGVGEGIREASVDRNDIFVTTKVWNDEQGYDETLRAFERSLDQLGFDFLDLYLIHWPVKDQFRDTWKAMERLYDEGVIKAIGVSNFHVHHLQNLMASANVKPVINQIEYHPHLTQEKVKQFCESEHIRLEAWSPMKKGRIFDDPTITEIADRYGKTPAQVILRWDVQNHVITIPKSVTPERIKQNADIFDFELTQDEMNQINAMNQNDRTGMNPDEFDEK
ncbi:aldo/keto reductase [Tenuibacillus multivorans]|uniref:Aldo/keto reductase n=1 Tax=Tenuibacillus multivorans TaxID=237069 RepID=A0A1H0C1T0_9BACI|nr:aldo/keto reductase [Tenuibacillus multivorans]GEL77732.1 putative oxidoreductase YtbE [Tenuibacillus multivorans]SDN51796.1 Aldo/keto reductase [Tenuibacillus multivorans]